MSDVFRFVMSIILHLFTNSLRLFIVMQNAFVPFLDEKCLYENLIYL